MRIETTDKPRRQNDRWAARSGRQFTEISQPSCLYFLIAPACPYFPKIAEQFVPGPSCRTPESVIMAGHRDFGANMIAAQAVEVAVDLLQHPGLLHFLSLLAENVVVEVVSKSLKVIDLSPTIDYAPTEVSLTTRRRSLFYSALEVVRVVDALCQICYSGREEEILEEMETRMNEGVEYFILEDRTRFPKTIDFIQEMAVRFSLVKESLKQFQQKFEALTRDITEALRLAEAQQLWKKMTFSSLALGGAVLALYNPRPITLAVTGVVGVIAAYKCLSPHEEMKQKMEKINTDVHKLSRVVVVIEWKTHRGKLEMERANVHREAPPLSSVQNSITIIFRILSKVDIKFQKAQIESLLHSN